MSYANVPPPGSLRDTSKYSRTSDQRLINAENEKKYNELMKSQKLNAKVGLDKDEEENDYFYNSSDEEEANTSQSNGRKKELSAPNKHNNDEDEDELDTFMAEINKQAQKEVEDSKIKEDNAIKGDYSGGREGRDDIDEEDIHESMIKFMEEYKERHQEDDNDVFEYDEDGNIIWTWKKVIDPLQSINHSEIKYQSFNKNLYDEHEEIRNLTPQQTFELRIALDIRVYGRDPPKPVVSFAHFNFDKAMMAQIRKSEFSKPTPIQAQAIPAALSGRDVLGLAMTGSGKTLAYIWPAIVHIMHQQELSPDDGPIALILVPTRELALQVYNEAKRYATPYNISVVCAYGGGSKYEQSKALEEGAELVIGTPGRLIDLVKTDATNFLRTTFLVFDEVDRMFDLGFEAQVKSIADHCRPDRQTLVFSATCKSKVEKLVMHALYDPVKVVCGDIGEASTDVQQTIFVLPDVQAKFNWLFSNIVKFITMGKVLIFVTKKVEAEDVAKKLSLRDIELVLLHGDMHQMERNERITAFRTTKSVMVATDVAARGLDISEIRNVINFDVARDVDTHVHRVGRTGRAGHQGFAYTLVMEKDSDFSAHLVKNLEASGQTTVVTPELLAVALKCPWFKEQYEKQKLSNAPIDVEARTMGITFKPKERPGFGLSNKTTTSVSSEATSAQPTISKQIERAKSLANTGNVTGMSKMDMMRSALKSTFKHSFQMSSGNMTESQITASDPRPEWKIRLDEQAEKINKAIQQKGNDEPGEDAPKKRSRWGN